MTANPRLKRVREMMLAAEMAAHIANKSGPEREAAVGFMLALIISDTEVLYRHDADPCERCHEPFPCVEAATVLTRWENNAPWAR